MSKQALSVFMIALLALGLVVAGCGGGEEENGERESEAANGNGGKDGPVEEAGDEGEEAMHEAHDAMEEAGDEGEEAMHEAHDAMEEAEHEAEEAMHEAHDAMEEAEDEAEEAMHEAHDAMEEAGDEMEEAGEEAMDEAEEAAAHDAGGDHETPWGKATVGDMVKYEMVGGTMAIWTVKEVGEEEVEIEMVMEVGGREMPPQMQTMPRFVTGDGPGEMPPGAEVKDLGTETVTIDGKEVECKVTETKVKMGDKTVTSKVWTSDDVPGGMVKTMSDAMGEMKVMQKVVAFEDK